MPLRQARATRQNGAGAGVRARAGAGALARAFRLLFLLLLPAALGAYALAWGLSAALWPDTPPETPRPHLQHAHARAAGAHRYDAPSCTPAAVAASVCMRAPPSQARRSVPPVARRYVCTKRIQRAQLAKSAGCGEEGSHVRCWLTARLLPSRCAHPFSLCSAAAASRPQPFSLPATALGASPRAAAWDFAVGCDFRCVEAAKPCNSTRLGKSVAVPERRSQRGRTTVSIRKVPTGDAWHMP